MKNVRFVEFIVALKESYSFYNGMSIVIQGMECFPCEDRLRERDGAVQPGEEKARGRPDSDVLVSKGELQKRRGHTL